MYNILVAIPDPNKTPQKDYYLINLEKSLIEKNIKLIYLHKSYKIIPISRNLIASKARLIHFHWIKNFTNFSLHKFKMIESSLKFFLDLVLVKYILRRKVLWTVHNILSHELIYPKFEILIRKLFVQFVDHFLVHCESAKKILVKEYGIRKKRISVIPHGNYINNYHNQISKKEARRLLDLDNKDFIFLYFGRIRPHKDIELLVQAFKQLKHFNRIKLMVIGNPIKTYKERITKLLKNVPNILYKLEFIPDNEIQVYMNAADVVTLPYKRILTSGEALLAMTFKKPIIAPLLGCLNDILDNDNAFLYKAGDMNDLKKKLEEAIINKYKLSKMAINSLNKAKKYDWDSIGKKVKKVYRLLI
ncbi:MAG: glycosyltransferase family 4 protein [Promethearchaeota archaeon]